MLTALPTKSNEKPSQKSGGANGESGMNSYFGNIVYISHNISLVEHVLWSCLAIHVLECISFKNCFHFNDLLLKLHRTYCTTVPTLILAHKQSLCFLSPKAPR